MASVTQTMLRAWERECRGLSLEEMGALWTLTAAAQCGWFGEDGQLRASDRALAEMMNRDERVGETVLLLEALRRRGKIRVEVVGDAGSDGRALLISVCFWSDLWARERASKRTDAKV